eukprot:CAMPEP_0181087970 /NCGR_PEP_ID=MMETSP1071-20121207/6544_1 /TAXON_ID=35127 /ORGANISM="Thalassiosira sp., Strain NH16" /LENGTH=407 /DNA_ID=CAMNT_0023169869 /DNA_START=429 /DNA_END=1652 /DNA_ORIENTATION=-
MNFAFADDAPVQTGRKHRRGRGYMPNRQNAAAANRNQTGVAANGHQLGRGGSQASSQSQQRPQGNLNLSANANRTNSNKDDNNSCAGSLEYSQTSSIAEDSNESSFADILKVFDSEVNGSSEVKDFIARQSQAANGGGGYAACGGGQYEAERTSNADAAVQGWMQRVDSRKASALQQMKQAPKTQPQKKQQQKFTMAEPKHVPTNPNVDFNYSINDSSESEEVFEVDFDGNVLETIVGHDDEVAVPKKVSATTQSKAPAKHPFRGEDRYVSSAFNNNTAASNRPSSRGRTSRRVTPPPNSRHKHTSAAHFVSNSISPSNSRHSKSSSEGSLDTPVPSSPPHNGLSTMRSAKPPPRNAPAPKSRRNAGRGGDDKAVASNAFYAKPWMNDFADSLDTFDFDSEPAFPTP